MRFTKENMLLYAVTDRTWTARQSLYDQVKAAIAGGITCLQLREKDLDTDAMYKEALPIRDLCRIHHIPFIINDRVDLAMKCDADGVHIGQDDMDAATVRKLIGPDKILGVTAHNKEEAILAYENGADYLGCGAVFSTSTKANTIPLSHEVLQEICQSVPIPIVAIGGIHKNNIMELAGTGVDGIALVSAIFSAADIEDECKELKALSERMVHTCR